MAVLIKIDFPPLTKENLYIPSFTNIVKQSGFQMTEKVTVLTILVIAVLVLSVVNIVGLTYLGGKLDGVTGNVVAKAQDNPSPSVPSQPSAPTEPSRLQVSLDDDAVMGDPNAPVTIVEFSDYECPFCGRFYTETLPLLKQQYVDTGKAKIVFRDFPLSFHPNAQKAAEAAECVGDQGGDEAYFEMHDLIFENQQSLSVSSLKQWARTVAGINGAEFDSCLDSGKFASEVQADFNEGAQYGVSGTPSFYINGVEIVGAQPFQVFRQAIEQELSK